MGPHCAFCASQVVGVHGGVPHLYGESKPQTWPGGQSPQSIRPVQPSPILPHSAFASEQLCGLHVT